MESKYPLETTALPGRTEEAVNSQELDESPKPDSPKFLILWLMILPIA